jgi:prepilin signal peptidase PulO-like enzyme (type II secretory pathway)
MRRAVFFLVSAVVCFLLVAPTPAEFRWLTVAVGILYVLLAIGSWLDARGQQAPR